MRLLFFIFYLGMGVLAHGTTISSYVEDSGVTVLTNQSTYDRSISLDLSSGMSTNFVPLINSVAARHGVDQGLVQAIVKVESDYNPRAVSPKNCKGLMQLHPDTASRFGVQDVLDPAQNLEGGVRFLSYLIATFGYELDHVLAAYNAGENAVWKHKGIPPYPETIGYVKKVKALFKGDFGANPDVSPQIVRVEFADGQILFTNNLDQVPADSVNQH